VLYPLSYTGIIPAAGIEPATTRVRGEVTVVFTTGQSLCFNKPAGEPTRKADSGHDFSRYLVIRDYAPVPGTLIPGRAAALHVDSFWREVSLLFHHRRNKLMPLVQ
jgi:hypothetical protein